MIEIRIPLRDWNEIAFRVKPDACVATGVIQLGRVRFVTEPEEFQQSEDAKLISMIEMWPLSESTKEAVMLALHRPVGAEKTL